MSSRVVCGATELANCVVFQLDLTVRAVCVRESGITESQNGAQFPKRRAERVSE